MPTSNYVGTLKINELTTAQYNAAVQSDIISDDDLSFLTDALDEQQTTMPTAEAKYEGQVVQFVGTTDANYTNGYFYKCVSDGGNPATYSWTRVDVQPAGTTYTAGTGIDITGGVVSVASPTLTNVGTGSNSLLIGTATSDKNQCVCVGSLTPTATGQVLIGFSAGSVGSSSNYSTVIGWGASARNATCATAVGQNADVRSAYGISLGNGYVQTGSSYSIAIGNSVVGTNTPNAMQICMSSTQATNSNANTVKIANANGNFEMMSADGTIPTDRFTTTPVADGTYVPTLSISSGTATRTWAAPASGLPSQTGHSGEFLTTDGTDASWASPVVATFRNWGANE